jgi:hypothetical protein
VKTGDAIRAKKQMVYQGSRIRVSGRGASIDDARCSATGQTQRRRKCSSLNGR